MLSRSPVEPVQKHRNPAKKRSWRNLKAPRAAPVRIYTNAEDLVGKTFRDLARLAANPAATNQDPPPNIPTARKRMQIIASKMKANAVLAAQL